jgi:hypothetical protein
MNTQTRLKLEMANRARKFCEDHPFGTPGPDATVARLKEQLAHAQALAEQAGSGRIAVRAAVVTRSELRQALGERIQLLVRVSDATAKEQPEMTERLKLPARGASHQRYLTALRVMVSEATPRQELLGKYGLPAEFLGEMAATLDQYQAAVDAKTAGTSAQVGATAELLTVTDEIMETIRLLDGFNRYRFPIGSEERAAWHSMRDVAWRNSGKADAPPAPAAEAVKPAA